MISKLAKDTDNLLDDRQKARFKELNAIERVLFLRMMSELKNTLSEKDGRITSSKGFVSLGRAVDAVFDAVEAEDLAIMAGNTVKDIGSVLQFNARYYDAMQLQPGSAFAVIKENVDAAMRKRLGIDQQGGLQRKGYLDQLFQTKAARDEVKKMVAKSVAAGIPMRSLEKQMRVKLQGTKNTAGVLEKHIGGFVLDAYQQADSITNNEFAKRLDLRFFIYSGGLIETSREFCRKRNNQVYTTDEATDPRTGWATDPTLPQTKAEQESGVITDYDPLVDRGRWNCRHRLLYISEQMARQRRPDLFPVKA